MQYLEYRHTIFEQKDNMTRSLGLRSKLLVRVRYSIIQSGYPFFYQRELIRRGLGRRLWKTTKTTRTLKPKWNNILACLRIPLNKSRMKSEGSPNLELRIGRLMRRPAKSQEFNSDGRIIASRTKDVRN